MVDAGLKCYLATCNDGYQMKCWKAGPVVLGKGLKCYLGTLYVRCWAKMLFGNP